MQSVEEENLKVRYKLRATVSMTDAEGKAYEVKMDDPTCNGFDADKPRNKQQSVHVFPKLFAPIRTRRETRLAPISVDSVADCQCNESSPDEACVCDHGMELPLYGEHVFDTLYQGDACLSADDVMTFGSAR